MADKLALPGIMSPDICSVSLEQNLIVVGSNASHHLHFVPFSQGWVVDVAYLSYLT